MTSGGFRTHANRFLFCRISPSDFNSDPSDLDSDSITARLRTVGWTAWKAADESMAGRIMTAKMTFGGFRTHANRFWLCCISLSDFNSDPSDLDSDSITARLRTVGWAAKESVHEPAPGRFAIAKWHSAGFKPTPTDFDSVELTHQIWSLFRWSFRFWVCRDNRSAKNCWMNNQRYRSWASAWAFHNSKMTFGRFRTYTNRFQFCCGGLQI